MNFTEAIDNQEARTANGMKSRASSASACVDLFFNIGASRGKDIIPAFVAAFVENEEYALRIAQWARDVRGGAGERQLFKDILAYLEKHNPAIAVPLIANIPEIGRWDDMLIDYTNKVLEHAVFDFYKSAIELGNPLAAKWAPRKGYKAKQLREAWNMTPKQYRKTLVSLTNVVETKMCAKEWNHIDFSKVPSLASARYKSAFYRNAEAVFTKYVESLSTGETKVNAGAVYPYDVLKGLVDYYGDRKLSKVELDHIEAQWNALENFVSDANVFPMVDVSGSMMFTVGNSKNTCLDIAVSLGLYLADKNTGKMKDCFLTFSGNPSIVNLKGNIIQKISQMTNSDWGINTNLHAAFEKMLHMAVKNNVSVDEMPETLLILSDMQFDRCTRFDDSAYEMIERKYEDAGYKMPNIVFWNLNANGDMPVKFDKRGTALVSGFSPSIMRAVLAGGKEFTPESIMLKAIMSERYALV